MPRGGARPNSGPAPDPFSLRTAQRQATGIAAGWIVLPLAGRPGAAPDWPLTSATARELDVWARLWATPQATQWERLAQEVQVAIYVRRLVEVEKPGAAAALGSLVVRLADGLGLTIPGLRANRWQLGAEQAQTASVRAIRGDSPRSARDRMAVRTATGEESD